MSLISRYLLRLHLVPFVFGLAAMTGVMMVNQIAKRLPDLVGKGLPWNVIAEVFLLSVPFIVAMTLPMAVLVAVLYTMSRLTVDNELTALRAGGVSLGRIARPLVIAGMVVSGVAFIFSDQVLPRTNHRLRALLTDINRQKPTFALDEQVINEVQRGRMFLRPGEVNEATATLQDVTIVDLSDHNRKRVTYADSAHMAFSNEDLYLTLFHGTMHETDRISSENFQVADFERDRVRVKGVASTFTRTLNDNFKSDREMGVCEMDSVITDARQDYWRSVKRAAAVETNALRGAVGLAPIVHDTTAPAVKEHLYCRLITRLAAVVRPPELEATVSPETGQDTLRVAPVGLPPSAGGRPVEIGPRASEQDAELLEQFNDEARRIYAGQVAPPRINTAKVLRDRAQDARVRGANYLVEFHKKYAIAVACIVFVIIGIPLAIRFPRGGVGLVFGISLVTFTVYYVGLIAGESLANKLIVPPFWAMWTPNVLFGAIGVIALYAVRKEATAGRGDGSLWKRLLARRTARTVRPA